VTIREPEGPLAHHLRHTPTVRWLFLLTGWIALVLGLIGIPLPVLPTTPFLLLAAACFLRSSPRFHQWLVNHRLLGNYLRFYLDGRGLPRRAKVGTITLLWLTMTPTALLIVPWPWLSVLLIGIAVAVTIYMARLPEPAICRAEGGDGPAP
jgi:uncharacterized membrane protein YbaN (DUF454 family)